MVIEKYGFNITMDKKSLEPIEKWLSEGLD